MDPKHYSYELKNGMKVVIVPRKTYGLVYLSLVMRNGKIDETPHTLSFTHAGEHLLAKFTSKKYQRYNSVKGKLGLLGVENNAYTSTFHTGYWLLGDKKHLPFMMSLLSFAFFQYKFTDDWIKQRNIVLEEIKARNSTIWSPLYESIAHTLYPNHRLGATWQDEMNVLARASLKEVLNFNLKKWNPTSTMILVEGDVEAGLILPELTRWFDQECQSSVRYELSAVPVAPLIGPHLIRVPIPNSHVSKLIYMYQLPQFNRFDATLNATLSMMLRYFCTGYYSRLYQVLREKHGLIYSLSSEYDLSPVPDILPGLLKIEIQVDPQQVDQVMSIVDSELERLTTFIIPCKEMVRLKNNANFQYSMENLDHRPGKFAEHYAEYIGWDQPVQTYTDYYKMLQKVKARNIQQVAKRIFLPQYKLVAIGEGSKDYPTKPKPKKHIRYT